MNLGLCFTVSQSYRQSVGLLRGGSASHSATTYTQKHKQNKRKHPCLKRDSNPWPQCSSGQRQFMPQTVWLLWSVWSSYCSTSSIECPFYEEYHCTFHLFGVLCNILGYDWCSAPNVWYSWIVLGPPNWFHSQIFYVILRLLYFMSLLSFSAWILRPHFQDPMWPGSFITS
jgi:hypothetical protein